MSCFIKSAGENLTESTQMTTLNPILSENKLNNKPFYNQSTFFETPKQ